MLDETFLPFNALSVTYERSTEGSMGEASGDQRAASIFERREGNT